MKLLLTILILLACVDYCMIDVYKYLDDRLLILHQLDMLKDDPIVTMIEEFNKRTMLPRLKSIVSLDYFRYVKINLKRPCTLWDDFGKCNRKDCRVKTCDDLKISSESYDKLDQLSAINTNVSSDQIDLLLRLFECHDSEDDDAQYIDLVLNPERYTGYNGEPSNRVWLSIYEENCFQQKPKKTILDQNVVMPNHIESQCYEEHLFYRAISGLHTSITIHLCAEYPLRLDGTFGPNFNEFTRRFLNHNEYLINLYKLYLLELKALAKCETFLLRRIDWSSNEQLSMTGDAIKDLMRVIQRFDNPFEEPIPMAHEMALHFQNITTRIMDCVACDRCKLWGKVQLQGLGTALKILSAKNINAVNIKRYEIVSLINALARLSRSVRFIDEVRVSLRKDYHLSVVY